MADTIPVDSPFLQELRKQDEKIAVLKKALAGLVGTDKKEELEQMDLVARAMVIPDADRANTINAIRALLET